MELRKICICGGGNIAHALAAVLGARPGLDVCVLTRRPLQWRRHVHAIYRDELEVVGTLRRVSAEASEVVPGANVVLIALPSFARAEVLERIRPYLDPGACVGAIPAPGGFDWEARSILGPERCIFGFHRTPYLCRTVEYGSTVGISGVAPEMFLAARPARQTSELARVLQAALNIPIVPAANFLTLTLTPTNPVVHPVGLYALFREWRPGMEYDRVPCFYDEWSNEASEVFLACDEEIQATCARLPMDLSRVVPIRRHYSVSSADELTRRIRGIPALHGIRVPMVPTESGWVPDVSSRWFTEDVACGTVVIRAVAEIAGVATPTLDAVIGWAQELMGRDLLHRGSVRGPGSTGLPIPQNFGIDTVERLVRAAE